MQYNVMLEITCDCNNPHTVFNESAVCRQHSALLEETTVFQVYRHYTVFRWTSTLCCCLIGCRSSLQYEDTLALSASTK